MGKNKSACQMQKNIALLQEIEFFSKVAPHVLKVLGLLCRRVCLIKGDVLFHKGDDPAQAIYIISGGFELVHNVAEQRKAEPGELVGTLNLCSAFPSLFSMTAHSDSEVLILDRESFDKVVEQFPAVRKTISAEAISRVHKWDEKQCKTESIERPFGGASLL